MSLITLGVADVERSRRFYESLGWSAVPSEGEDVVFFQAGPMVVALWSRQQLADDSCVRNDPGWGGVTLAYNVRSRADVEEVTAEARAAGATIGREPAETFWGGYTSIFIDPDGHPWEIAHNPGWTVEDDGSITIRRAPRPPLEHVSVATVHTLAAQGPPRMLRSRRATTPALTSKGSTMLTRSRRTISLTVAAVVAAVLAVGPSASAQTDCGTFDGRGCAPESKRVDVATPTFSNPTNISNPLFPISDLHSALLLGHVDGKPFRTETTLLGSETVLWRGQAIQVLVSQYMAYLDGRLDEVALDRYAQADDGSVWYFGEDVFDYRNGAIAVTEGTWLAGRDGPPAMIMPAQPEVGQVYRPENAPNIVFEEVTVAEVGKTVDGPLGKVDGAIVADELHQDGGHELKIFAPGYGEFSTGDPAGDLEALALAVPKDSLPGLPSQELATMSSGAVAMLESVRLDNWPLVKATLARVESSWDVVKSANQQPKPVAALITQALRTLKSGVKARNVGAVAQAAIDLGQSSLDLELRHRPPVEIDSVRLELWTQQLRVDAAAEDLAGVTNDVGILEWIRDRFAGSLDAAGRAEIDTRLRDLRAAADAENLPAAADHAARLGARIRHLTERQPVG